jgi:hypothetical protein
MTLPIWLSEIETRLKAASPMQWTHHFGSQVIFEPEKPWRSPTSDEVKFIADAPDDIARLISALKTAVDALEWFAREEVYPHPDCAEDDLNCEVIALGQDRAREALAKIKEMNT